ncbi:MAG: glutamine-hydrolyzing carbamoyl-phosphate synthase small subunit [Campylobacteraceae bacterium]
MKNLLKPVWIYIENGVFIEAKSFGVEGTRVGEIVFNTSMTGYQEIVTDPSYAGQFIVFTMPEIGIVGSNDDDMESKSVHASGVIIRNINKTPSNFRSKSSFVDFLKKYNGFGICDIDTRFLTKMIRNEGPKMMIASTKVSDLSALKNLLKVAPRIEDLNYISEIGTKESYVHTSGAWNDEKLEYKKANHSLNKKIVAIDYGVKRNILNELSEAGLSVEVVPHDTKAKAIIKRFKEGKIQGVFLSNGPGDPQILKDEIAEIKLLIEAKVPIFAICLGHQLLSLAHGYETVKMKFGQHGGNHPVRNEANKVVEITAQNHNYSVTDEVCKIAKVTHMNLFDNTIEGLDYNDSPIFSVQHHPEASPGPHDSKYIFLEFANRI